MHNEVRLEKKEADCRLLTLAVQRVADRLAALNGIAPPTFVMEDGSGLEMERAQRDKILVEAGMLKFTPEYLAEKYGLESGDFEVPATPPVTPAGSGAEPAVPTPPAPDPGAPDFRARLADGDKPARQEFTAGQQALEDQIGANLAALPSPIEPGQIRGAILAARDADDLVERLGILLRDADRTTFNRVLERALFAADVMGYAHAADE